MFQPSVQSQAEALTKTLLHYEVTSRTAQPQQGLSG